MRSAFTHRDLSRSPAGFGSLSLSASFLFPLPPLCFSFLILSLIVALSPFAEPSSKGRSFLSLPSSPLSFSYVSLPRSSWPLRYPPRTTGGYALPVRCSDRYCVVARARDRRAVKIGDLGRPRRPHGPAGLTGRVVCFDRANAIVLGPHGGSHILKMASFTRRGSPARPPSSKWRRTGAEPSDVAEHRGTPVVIRRRRRFIRFFLRLFSRWRIDRAIGRARLVLATFYQGEKNKESRISRARGAQKKSGRCAARAEATLRPL